MIPTVKQIVLASAGFLGTAAVVAGAAALLFGPTDRVLRVAVVIGTGVGVWPAIQITGWSLRPVFATARLSGRVVAAVLGITVGTLLIQAGAFLTALALVRIEIPPDTSGLTDLRGLGGGAVVVAAVIGAPIFEELFVRGVLLRAIGLRFGFRTGLIATALIFGLLHTSLLRSPMMFISGFIWGGVLLRTGNLGATIALHMVNNAIVCAAAIAATVADAAPQAPPPALPQAYIPVVVAVCGATVAVGAAVLFVTFRRLPHDPQRLARLWQVPLALVVAAPPDEATSSAAMASERETLAAPSEHAAGQ